jgi:hypothetical protein
MSQKKKPEKILVWHKVQSQGFQPSAREGHSTVTCGSKMIIWGGIETGRRVNTTQILDVSTGIWSAKAAGNSLMERDAAVKHDATQEDDAKGEMFHFHFHHGHDHNLVLTALVRIILLT